MEQQKERTENDDRESRRVNRQEAEAREAVFRHSLVETPLGFFEGRPAEIFVALRA